MYLSLIIFVIVYIGIMTEKVNKSILALLGAFFVLVFKLVPYEHAMQSIDLNVIFLLVGMMISVFVLSKTGFFEWTAISIAKAMKGNAIAILLFLLIITGIFSAFLDNVTTIILLAPVTILITQLLELPCAPFLILEAIASNLGGTATLIGDPPNILIGSEANLSFNDFLVNLGPIVLFIFGCFILTNFFIFRKKFKVSQLIKTRVIDSIPKLAITDKKLMKKALCVFGLILVGFFVHDLIGVKPGIIAMGGAVLMLLVARSDGEENFKSVEWGVIFFFIGLFIMISALEYNGISQIMANKIMTISGGSLFLTCILILWGSAFASAVFDNIPFVITMLPLVQYIIIQYSNILGVTDPSLIRMQIAAPLWWSLALGCCLGGNGTLIGTSANIVAVQIGAKNNVPISFAKFFRYGFSYMIQSIIIASIFIWLRYF